MTQLRFLKFEDLVDIVSLVRVLFQESYYSTVMNFDEESIFNIAKKIVEDKNQTSVCLILEDKGKIVGLLAGSHVKQLFNEDALTAAELAFYILPEYKTPYNLKLLLSAFRFWAKKTNCKYIQFGKLKEPKKLETYYIRKI